MTIAAGLLDALTLICFVATLPGTLELMLLTLGGVLPARRHRTAQLPEPFRLAVVIPAHDEELTINRCLLSLRSANRQGIALELIVIADNCTDGTALRARELGARVIERFNANERGKGYALDFAFQSLLPRGYQGFAVVDADSEVAPNFLTEICALLQAGAGAVQCRYLTRGIDDSFRSRLTRLASGAFNILRPRGRDRLGCSAGLYGNGFALSAETVRQVPYSACSVVEDVEYHLALVRAGCRVLFADGTAVYAGLPAAGSESADTQRARWEGGRLRMLAIKTPGLLREVLLGKPALIEPLLDLLLLPLAFHVVLLALAVFSPMPAVRELALAGLITVLSHLLATIRVTGGGTKEIGALAAAPFYVGWKLLLLPRLLKGARTDALWVRTERVTQQDTSLTAPPPALQDYGPLVSLSSLAKRLDTSRRHQPQDSSDTVIAVGAGQRERRRSHPGE